MHGGGSRWCSNDHPLPAIVREQFQTWLDSFAGFASSPRTTMLSSEQFGTQLSFAALAAAVLARNAEAGNGQS